MTGFREYSESQFWLIHKGKYAGELLGNSFFSNTHAYPPPAQLSLDLIPFLPWILLSEDILLGAVGKPATLGSWGGSQETPQETKPESLYSSTAELGSPRSDHLWTSGWVRPAVLRVWFPTKAVIGITWKLPRNAESETSLTPDLLNQKPWVEPLSLYLHKPPGDSGAC